MHASEDLSDPSVPPAEREEGRLRDEMNRLGLERAELKEKMNAYEVRNPAE